MQARKWVKQILKGIALLLALLLVTAFAFREWCVWRLPRMKREVDAAWKDYAGIALSEVPQRFPSQETNDAALKLEAAVAKLGICLAPTASDAKTCPRNAPTTEAVKEYEALSVKDAKGKARSLITDYVNHQMERPDRFIEPPPAVLQAYLAAHQADLDAITNLLDDQSAHWGFKTESLNLTSAINLGAHIRLNRLFAANALSALQSGNYARGGVDLQAMERLEKFLFVQPGIVNTLINLSERRALLALLRKANYGYQLPNAGNPVANWKQQFRIGHLYETWATSSREAITKIESLNSVDFDSDLNLIKNHQTESIPLGKRLWQRLFSPWNQLSVMQISLANIHDSRLFLSGDRCHPVLNVTQLPGISISNPVWYMPFSGGLQHPKLSWWNPTGKIIYAIAAPNGNEVARGFRLELESELTEKVLKLRAARQANGNWPSVIPGIESSVCKNEKWNYAVTPDGSATLAFSGKPEWGTMKGAQVPLRWTEPPPVK